MDLQEENTGPVVLTPDANEVFQREIRTMVSGLMYLVEHAKENKPIDRGLMQNVFYIAESTLSQLSTLTGVQCESTERIEQRFAEIRRANARVHELERLLGEGASAEQTRMAVKALIARASYWWRRDGFGHMRTGHVNEWGGVELNLSCHLFGNFRLTHSDTPVSDKGRQADWIESLRARGFVISSEGRSRHNLVDCDESREALIKLITAGIPSAEVRSFNNQAVKSQLVLRDVVVGINDINDLALLPEPIQE